MAEQAYLTGLEQIAWPTRNRVENGQLVLERPISDSANLNLMWDVPNHGTIVLSTGSLVERAAPYSLPLELARGKISQLRNQLAEWQLMGLTVPSEVLAKTDEAVECFGRAATGKSDAASLAGSALSLGCEAADMLVNSYVEQAIVVRRRNGAKLPTALGADLGSSLLDDAANRSFLATFNAAGVPFRWRAIQSNEGAFAWDVSDRQIEWCRTSGLRVYGGPLFCLDRASLPDWLSLWSGDYDNILAFALDYARAVVTRYRGQVHLWQCAGRLNTPETLKLTEEDALNLTARLIELIRSLDPSTPIVISVDQPWCEYLGRREAEIPPIHFADALIRAGLGLSGLMLEMNVGYWPDGSLCRDLLDTSRRMDQWAMLGLPIHVSVCVPSDSGVDPLAQYGNAVQFRQWDARLQRNWVGRFIPLMIAKPYVQGVLWNQLRDIEPHRFPYGGLFDHQRRPKMTLRTLASIRQSHLR